MVAINRSATIQDLDAIPDDDRVYELLNGEISVAATPTWKHQLTVFEIAQTLSNWVRSHSLGVVQIAPLDVILDERNVVQPDVIFVRSVDLANVQNGRFHGTPPLVVEVISPTSRGRDNVQKTQRYASAGIAEYWIVDPELALIDVYGLDRGFYQPVERNAEGMVVSTILTGLSVDPAAIFRRIAEQGG